MPTFDFAPGFRRRGLDPQKTGTELASLEAKLGRPLKPADVFKAAHNRRSHLRRFFVWNRDEAYRKLNIGYAQSLLSAVVLVIEDGSDEPTTTHAYLNPFPYAKGSAYYNTASVVEDADLLERVVAAALRDLENFERRYRRYQQLKPVFDAIAAVRAKVKKGGKKKRKAG